MAKRVAINLIKPHRGGQRAIYKHPARFQVIACGRRFGKTELGKLLAAKEMIVNGGEVWWVAPQYKMSTKNWRDLKTTFAPMTKWTSAQERRIELYNGGKLTVWSADSGGDSMRGGSPSLVIMDEAAMIPDESIWFGVLLPALSDHKGRAYFLSTPRGRNWFYNIYEFGKSGDTEHSDYKQWRFPSYYNPYISKDVIEKARHTSPEKFFRQEYLAQFLADSGEIFRGVESVIHNVNFTPYDGHFVMGIDWGKKNDFTVVTLVDVRTRHQVFMDRFNTIEYREQRQRIMDIYNEWKPYVAVIEDNNVGHANIEELKSAGMHIKPFYTTNKNKQEIIERLSVDIENKTVRLLNDRLMINELQAYQMNLTQSGAVKFSAPAGYHDDTIIALALANKEAASHSGVRGTYLPRVWH